MLKKKFGQKCFEKIKYVSDTSVPMYQMYGTISQNSWSYCSLPEMKWAPQRLDVASKSQELQVLQLVTVEITAHVDGLTSDDDDFVAV